MAFTSGNDVNILQSANTAVVGAGAGNDTYILSPFTLTGAENITISDTQGVNSLQLVGGLQIASSLVASGAMLLTLSNSSTITILGNSTSDVSNFTFEAGGNVTAGINNPDVNFATFVQNTLKTTVPTGGGVNSGGAVVIPGGSAGTTTTPLSAGDDILVLQSIDTAFLGAGAGNDTYILSASTLAGTENITITDAQGTNSLQLVGGLQIASSRVASDTLELTLSNGSAITLLGASTFTYEPGGNATAGINNPDVSFAAFVQNTLNTTVPTGGGINLGGAVTIRSGGALIFKSGGSPQFVAGTALDDFFYLSQADTVDGGAGSDTVYFNPGSQSAQAFNVETAYLYTTPTSAFSLNMAGTVTVNVAVDLTSSSSFDMNAVPSQFVFGGPTTINRLVRK